MLDGRKRWVAGGASAEVVFMVATVEGADDALLLALSAGAMRAFSER